MSPPHSLLMKSFAFSRYSSSVLHFSSLPWSEKWPASKSLLAKPLQGIFLPLADGLGNAVVFSAFSPSGSSDTVVFSF